MKKGTRNLIALTVIIGAFSLSRLRIDLLPNIELPTLTVRTEYEGASPEVMERLVTQIVEEIIATVPGVGMMVDGAIVVLENIFRRREQNQEPAATAAVEGAREVAPAIIASTLTTLVIFLPLVFVRGVSGIRGPGCSGPFGRDSPSCGIRTAGDPVFDPYHPQCSVLYRLHHPGPHSTKTPAPQQGRRQGGTVFSPGPGQTHALCAFSLVP
ncbi:MAG: efflux RND transporter permease subunit [Desulfobacteraceae bacterium]